MDLNHPSQPQLVEAGQEALVRGAWEEARSAFERALHTGDRDTAKHSFRAVLDPEGSAEILSGLAEALWWLGEIRASIDCWEQAYSGFRQRPDPAQAALAAIQLGILYDANLGNHAAAAGWVARAARLVDEHTLEPLRGWVLIAKVVDSADPGKHEALARQAHELGRASGDRDLELCALTQIGVALIGQGRITEGMAFHDEAMAGALAGEGQLDTVVFTTCEMLTSYSRCAQYQRMAQWIRAADRFVERYGCPYLNASCRTHYGGVLFATGDWTRAEEELRVALRLSENSLPAVQVEALARLAELRLAQGRVEEAERLIAGFEDHEASAPVSARIHLVRGKFALAAATSRRWLGMIGKERLESALLLELLGEAEIGQGQVEGAVERGRKLADLGSALDCQVMLARGERLRGRALAAASDSAAKGHLDVALREFAQLEMLFEAARTHLLIAQALCELDPEVAEAEAHAALAVFNNLGAVTEAEAATTVLSEIETRNRKRTGEIPDLAGLTRREVETLRLVAQGLSDKEIAAELVLSRHTVHRHIHSILTKLDLPSRAAAAAYAARHGLL
ncbi:MAG TPA: LuxR C-terminal-related transcriptional regulator [Rubrobacteraceae bacterium]|nr:LuxR C-terminal-related transcriptional regulator [Rubrobacteraceae bacterium]